MVHKEFQTEKSLNSYNVHLKIKTDNLIDWDVIDDFTEIVLDEANLDETSCAEVDDFDESAFNNLASGRIQRWGLMFQAHNFTLLHRLDKLLGTGDNLSRLPLPKILIPFQFAQSG
ncbi:unnamed protein product [Lepeophtheirus salmonis]|uniref:(salmon louse) hypothetical protein n=1 Tax=Lepeophtheirus salmonis TaxID=72036 RepID=A0A7R8H4P6_LEPSM|nr:unnamed protein product [Lepeophtheirus salmonis]CAF2852119.1 unnamed protein product [Lepeophtheirus salmonis]